MNSSSATVSAEVGPGIDTAPRDDALAGARTVCAAHPLGTLTITARRTGHPAMADAVLVDASASVRGRTVRTRAVAGSFGPALDHALARLTAQLDRRAALTAV